MCLRMDNCGWTRGREPELRFDLVALLFVALAELTRLAKQSHATSAGQRRVSDNV